MTTRAEGRAERLRFSLLLAERRDLLWVLLWAAGLALTWVWLELYLNAPARVQIRSASVHTVEGACAAVAFALVMGWGAALFLHFLESSSRRGAYLAASFLLNLLRSVPQIVGMLIGYVIVTALTLNETLTSDASLIVATSFVTALFLFQEVVDLIRERIRHFEALEFVSALLVCGVPSRVIVNREILLKNSMAHLVQKAVALFGRAIFLICSIDFIVSVGLSTEVNLSNFPVTLGSMLAKLDSKQDILAMGSILMNPSYATQILFQHLQGVSVAFIIVFTLLCVFQIADGLVRQYDL